MKRSIRNLNNRGAESFFRFFCLLLFLAVAATTGAKAQDVDVKKIVFDHIQDSYEWHITHWGEKPVRIPLPVIVKGETSGWHVFLSSRLDRGNTHHGFYIAAEGPYAGKVVEKNAAGEEVRPWDISLTKTALALLINCAVLFAVVFVPVRWYRRHPGEVPGGFVGAVEMLTTSIVDDVIKPCIGRRYGKYAPFLLTAFYFILVNNVLGIISVFPAGGNTTGNIAVTFILAFSVFLVVNIFGSREYWKEIFWPKVPIWLKLPVPLMIFIEIFGVFTKPFALMARLFANIMAGHSVILGITSLIFISATMGPLMNAGMSAVAILFTVFMNCLELLVAFIQAYVFTMLSAVFIGLAQAEPEKARN